ncbi:MAG: nicotinate-nucleotide adenylyltransferase [Firmicutes bacterium]|nr:nicotinate-nucleotide adenylyltransferase [Candidatus Fermentithermobacillaceae bacterium]
MANIGIMGGTFDPIHFGHLRAAEEVLQGFQLDRVIFVPAGNPPHKAGERISSAEHRYLMTVLATMDHPNFEVSRVEIDRPGFSYTLDTLREFRKRFPGDNLYFITGADAILSVHYWNGYRELFELADFIAVTRPGYSMESLDCLRPLIGEQCYSRIHVFTVTSLAISSSDIRDRVRKSLSIRYLTPETVRRYIERNGLYKD